MDINPTSTGPILPERGNSSTTSISSDSSSSTTLFQGHPTKKMLPARLHLHQLTRKDYKDRNDKEIFFQKFTKALMSITNWSQTTLLDNTLSTTKLIPYLRKITPEEMANISDNPADLQTTLLLELTVLIKQGYKLQELCRLATESALVTIKVNESNQTISIDENHFTRDDLGDDTFRELYDRLTASRKKKQKDPRVILADVQKRKAVSIDHWQDVLSMVLDSQDPATRQHITSALNTLCPTTETQCNTLISLIPTLTLKVHPGFLMMNTLSSWLAQHHLDGGKLSSKQLTWINSMDMHYFYTFIPRDLEERVKEEEKLHIYLEPQVSTGKSATPREQLAKKTIDDTPVPQLTKVVELFDALLCDLTPSVDATNRLGIIYTLLKFTDRPLLESLLTTSSIGSDLFHRMYLTQLVLTYPIVELPPNDVTSNELRMNCLIKTLQLRMARCIIMMASKAELSVPPSVLDKAHTLIDHHNEGLRAGLSDDQFGLSEDHYMDFDDFDDGYQENDNPSSNANISQSDYLSIPDHLLTQAVNLEPQKLILPQDKHFRIPSLKRVIAAEDRRIEQSKRDEKKQWEDCLLMSRSTDLTRAVDWAKIDIPITFLFSGSDYEKSRLPFVLPVFNNELLPIIQQAVSEATQQQTMTVISELLALSQSTGKPGLDIRAIITSIQDRASNPTLHNLLQQLAIKLPELHCNKDRRLLLEFCAFQLFSELPPSNGQFKRLVKMLYIIQSRSKQLSFVEIYGINSYKSPNNPKIPMGDFFRKGWNQPDGLLGSRIRQSIKDTFKQCDKIPDYQQVLDSLVESMRPSHQPSESYPELIQQLSLDTEKIMNQKRELEHLKKQFEILESHYKPHYPQYLDSNGRKLIELAAQLCELFLQEQQVCSTATASSEMVSADSDLTLSDQIDCEIPPDSYLHDQIKALISSIGSWLEQIHDDDLISEEDANAAGLGKLAEFVTSTTRVNPNHSLETEVKIVGQIIALRDKFHHLQNGHSQWKSSLEITSTQTQLVATHNILEHLKDAVLLAPDKLQNEINKIIFGSESHELSPEDKELLSTVSELRKWYAKTELVRKALSHPHINEFNRSPELLSHRIAEINSAWSESVWAQHHQCRSLERTLNKLQSKPLYSDFEDAQRGTLNRTRKWHDHIMATLQSTQQRCESHLVQQLSFHDGQPLLSILESMEQSHTAKHSGIEANPLSARQKWQLKAAIECAPADCSLSDGNSLFDWIGMKETRQQRIAAATNSGAQRSLENPETVKAEVFAQLAKFAQTNTDNISSEQKNIDSVNTTLAEMDAAHYDRVKELKASKEELSNRLNNQMLASININGETYSYADALVGFVKRGRHYHLNDVAQRTVARALNEAEWKAYNKSENYQRDQQWLQIAKGCQSHNINPATLPKVIELIELEEQEHIDDIENKIASLQQQIQSVEKTIADNSARVQAEVAKLKASLKPELEAQKQKTTDAQQALFTKAFEHGQQLSEGRAIQRVLCQYLRENRDTASVKANIVRDYEAQKKHIPNAADIIEPPWQYTGWRNWSSPTNLLFHIINVPGAFPLLESLHKKGEVSQRQLLRYDAEGKPSSALIFAAAKGRYKACETLIKCLIKSQTKSADKSDQPDNEIVQASEPLHLDNFIQMLTADRDNRNLLHYVAQLAKPEVWKALLQLITIVSNKQDFDADFPIECLQNRVAEDREHIIKMLLAQTDGEGLRPPDLLLFNVAKRIREWPEDNEQALTSYCNDFLLNDAKTMWKTASKSLSVEQLRSSMECFMKGIDDLDRLSPKKRQAAETFLDNLMRIFRVHGPAGQHEQMIEQLTSTIDELKIFDSPPTKRARNS